MGLKRYSAPTMEQALDQVKRELGREAVILHTRPVRKGGLLGLGGRKQWEVTATTDVNVLPRSADGKYLRAQPVADRAPDSGDSRPAEAPKPAAGRAVKAPPAEPARLARQVERLTDMVRRLLRQDGAGGTANLPAALRELRAHLLAQDVDPAAAGAIVAAAARSLTGEQLTRRNDVHARARELIAQRIPTTSGRARPPRDGRPYVIALIGPTGVGKTTTIAKLAANFQLQDNLRVGLVTLDTYRIAAVDQLRTYAEIVNVPLRTALSAGELHRAIRQMQDVDVVLVDTAGRSQNNQARLTELRERIGAAEADEIHLAVSATSNRACARSTVRRFAPLGPNRVLITKVDEAGSFGVILTVAQASGLPISYVTTGQEVPDDMAPADARLMADWILAGGIAGG